MRLCAIFLFTILISPPSATAANAVTADGNIILAGCTAFIDISSGRVTSSVPNAVDRNHAFYCAGHLLGMAELYWFYKEMGESKKHVFCIPKGVKPLQMAKVVVKFLNENPNRLHELGTFLMWNALEEAFPCES